MSMVRRFEKFALLDVRNKPDDSLIAMVMLLSIYGLFRVSELLNEPEFWVEIVNGMKQLHVKLTDTKTLWRNDGQPEIVVISECKETSNYTWCPVRLVLERYFKQEKGCRKRIIPITMSNGKKLTRSVYSAKLKKLLELIGIDSKKYDTHSGRIGGATMLWEAGYSDAQIKRFGRWRSESWSIYCRELKSKFIELSETLSKSSIDEKDIVIDTDLLVVDMNRNR